MSSNRQLAEAYRRRFGGREDYRTRVWRILCRYFYQRFMAPGQRVLDLGAGWGEFINQVPAAHKYAMDLNSDSARHLLPEVQFLERDCATTWPLESDSLDLVFTSNFLEHLSDKNAIERTLAEAWRCLAPGGRILCLGPNIRLVGGAYWDFWDHHVALTEASLEDVLRLTGFETEHCIAGFLPYTMSGGRPPPAFLLSVYLRLPVLWRVFGKQFLLLARKVAA